MCGGDFESYALRSTIFNSTSNLNDFGLYALKAMAHSVESPFTVPFVISSNNVPIGLIKAGMMMQISMFSSK